MDNLYSAGNAPLLVGDMLVRFGDILPETSQNSACWDIGGNSHLTWLSIDSLYISSCIELELESMCVRNCFDPRGSMPSHLTHPWMCGRSQSCVHTLRSFLIVYLHAEVATF